jgi:uncharacterized membrane protein YhaH (DUF805 family)
MSVILRPLRLYANFTGRASRAEYWLFGLFKSGLLALLLLTSFMVRADVDPDASASIGWISIGLGLGGVAALGLLLPDLALMARRMHDINLSAQWMWLLAPGYLLQGLKLLMGIAAFLPLPEGPLTTLMQQAASSPLTTNVLLNLLTMLSGTVICVIVAIRGNKGPNRYGDDPKGDQKSSPKPLAPEAPTLPTFDEERIDAAINDLKIANAAMTSAQNAPPAPVSASQAVRTTEAKPTFGRRR